MDHQPQVHQPVSDDRVRDKGDEDEAEIRTDPAVQRSTGDQRQQEGYRNYAGSGQRRRSDKVLELKAFVASCLSPLVDADAERATPRREEVEREERLYGPKSP